MNAGTVMDMPEHIAAGTLRLEEESLDASGLVLTASGELDHATAPELRARLTAAIDAGVNRLVIDLRPLSFLDSVALAVLLHARTDLGDAGRMAVVVAPGSYTRLIFEVAGLPRCVDVFETREQAVAHVADRS
jgi:anti-sigma B factor antagonist